MGCLALHTTTTGAPIDVADGYIHFSTAQQASETAAKHFAGQDDLFLIAVEADTLGDDLKWEVSRGDALFPAPLPGDAHCGCPLGATPAAEKRSPSIPHRRRFRAMSDTHIDPTRAQFDAFKELDREHPIEMLNLVRFRDLANYPGDHDLARDGLTGAQAYALYGKHTAAILEKVGGSIVWRAQFQTTLIGPDGETWDAMFVARYPTAHAFMAMVSDPDYQIAVVHRQAAVATSRLIRTAPADGGSKFG